MFVYKLKDLQNKQITETLYGSELQKVDTDPIISYLKWMGYLKPKTEEIISNIL